MKQQLDKLRKKGKYSDYRDVKKQLIKELKESDAIGLDLGQTSKYNNMLIKEVLAIYFDVLKNKSESPLLRSVFLGLPSFTQYVNVEIVWDLINVLREYLKMTMDQGEEDSDIIKKKKNFNVSNVLSGLLCAFQLIDVGAGNAFNVEEKDFIDALYAVVLRLVSGDHAHSDFLAFLKCMTIVFINRRQYSIDLVNAFLKRLAVAQVHLAGPE